MEVGDDVCNPCTNSKGLSKCIPAEALARCYVLMLPHASACREVDDRQQDHSADKGNQ